MNPPKPQRMAEFSESDRKSLLFDTPITFHHREGWFSEDIQDPQE